MQGRRGGGEKEREKKPERSRRFLGYAEAPGPPAVRFPAKRHQLEHFPARPRVWFLRVKKKDAPCSLICLLPFPPSLLRSLSKPSLSTHQHCTFSTPAVHSQAKSCKVETWVLENLTAHLSPRVYQNALSSASFQNPIVILLRRMLSKFGGEWPCGCWSPRLPPGDALGVARDRDVTRQSCPEQTCRPLRLQTSSAAALCVPGKPQCATYPPPKRLTQP